MNIADILSVKYKNELALGQITLQDNSDGKGIFIQSWNVPNVPKPTKAQLLAMAQDPDNIKAAKIAQWGSDIEQKLPKKSDLILALWKKLVENDSTDADALQVLRQQIIAANPKPTE